MPSVSTLNAIVSELDLSANEIVFESREGRKASDGESRPKTGRAQARALPRVAALDHLVADAGASSVVQRSHNRRAIRLDSGVVWERLTSAPDHGVDFLYVVYPPGAESTPATALMRHNGREYGFVLSGRLLVSIQFEDYELGPGDSIAFDSTRPHRLATVGDEPVEAVWVVVGRRQ